MMESEFQMSMMGELTFSLGIQVKQTKQGNFMHQAKYTKDLMKKFNMAELKPVSTLMSSAASLGPKAFLLSRLHARCVLSLRLRFSPPVSKSHARLVAAPLIYSLCPVRAFFRSLVLQPTNASSGFLRMCLFFGLGHPDAQSFGLSLLLTFCLWLDTASV
jgi:hypothetical protein